MAKRNELKRRSPENAEAESGKRAPSAAPPRPGAPEHTAKKPTSKQPTTSHLQRGDDREQHAPAGDREEEVRHGERALPQDAPAPEAPDLVVVRVAAVNVEDDRVRARPKRRADGDAPPEPAARGLASPPPRRGSSEGSKAADDREEERRGPAVFGDGSRQRDVGAAGPGDASRPAIRVRAGRALPRGPAKRKAADQKDRGVGGRDAPRLEARGGGGVERARGRDLRARRDLGRANRFDGFSRSTDFRGVGMRVSSS